MTDIRTPGVDAGDLLVEPPPAHLPPDAALFFDVDGTLIDIAPRPDAVVVPERMLRLLDRCHARFDGAVALVSGRSVADIDRLVTPLQLSAAGLHGLEQRLGHGPVRRPAAAPWVPGVAAVFQNFATEHSGILVEDKGLTVALHYRLAPGLEDAAVALAMAQAAAIGSEVVVQTGKMVVELRPRGATKGGAILAFMEQAPFRGRLPVFAGDDVTDEHGFEMVNRLGGMTIRVGVPDTTEAQYALPSPAAFLDWLDARNKG